MKKYLANKKKKSHIKSMKERRLQRIEQKRKAGANQ